MRVLVLLGLLACSKSDAPRETYDQAPGEVPTIKTERHVAHPALAADEGRIAIDAPAAEVGKPSIAHVTVTPAAGYHINDRYPFKLRLDPADGVELPKSRLARDDGTIDAQHLAIGVAYTARRSGDLVLAGSLEVGVCRETACLTRTTPIAIRVAAR